MKILKVGAIAAIIACMMASSVLAANTNSTNNKSDSKGTKIERKGGYCKDIDPAKMLESSKERIQQMVTDGKITQEEATTKITELEAKIAEQEAFNALTVEEKKAKLTTDYTAKLTQQVTDGKLTQAQADERLASYTKKIANWDGTGMPMFGGKGGPRGQGSFEGKGGPREKGEAPEKMDSATRLAKDKERIQQQVTDGKITQEQATTEIAKLEAKIAEREAFNALTLEEKKAKLTTDYTAKLTQQVTDGKVTQAQADERLASYTEKLANWDGTGMPMLGGKGGPRGQGSFEGKGGPKGHGNFEGKRPSSDKSVIEETKVSE